VSTGAAAALLHTPRDMMSHFSLEIFS
jgi:hypothetical protein